MARRRLEVAETPQLPRWVTHPLVLDWFAQEEIDATGEFIRYPGFCPYTDALDEWCRPFGGDCRDYDRGYPKLPSEAHGVDPAVEPPSSELVASALQRERERCRGGSVRDAS